MHTAYVTGVLPAELLLGGGMGCVFTPAFSLATSGVDRRDAGIAAAVVQTGNQVAALVFLLIRAPAGRAQHQP